MGDSIEKRKWQVSYLSNVVDLHTRGERSSKVFTTLGDNLAIYCVKEEGWYRPVEFELLDGAETLLPHFLPEEYGNAWDWAPTQWMPQVSYERDRDVLRLFNDETAAMSWYSMAENLKVGCDKEGRPVCVELTGAAELLLPLMLPLSEEVTPINQEMNR